MSNRIRGIDILFIVQLVLFGLIITGVLPREVALYLGAALVIYFLAVPVEDSLVFFVRSIPLFLAMPLTAGFDNFNVWRILVVIIFLKWLLKETLNSKLEILNKLKIQNSDYFAASSVAPGCSIHYSSARQNSSN